MEQIHRSSIEADNRLRSLETDQKRLELCHQMLNNISTQATLLLGFSLATYGADLLPIVLREMLMRQHVRQRRKKPNAASGSCCRQSSWTPLASRRSDQVRPVALLSISSRQRMFSTVASSSCSGEFGRASGPFACLVAQPTCRWWNHLIWTTLST